MTGLWHVPYRKLSWAFDIGVRLPDVISLWNAISRKLSWAFDSSVSLSGLTCSAALTSLHSPAPMEGTSWKNVCCNGRITTEVSVPYTCEMSG